MNSQNPPKEEEPIYGKTYLRKFKISVAIPPTSEVDIFAQDLGFIAVASVENLKVSMSFGGELEMTHNKQRHPRIADVIGFVRTIQPEVAEQV